MNTPTIVLLVTAMAIEHIAGIIVQRQHKGSPLTRGMWLISIVLFMAAVGVSDYLAGIAVWLRVLLAIVLGLVVAYVWLPISSIINAITVRPTRAP